MGSEKQLKPNMLRSHQLSLQPPPLSTPAPLCYDFMAILEFAFFALAILCDFKTGPHVQYLQNSYKKFKNIINRGKLTF